MNLHGLRKPPYHAFQLLGRLGSQRVPVAGGDGWTDAIATADGGKRVLVYRHPQTFDQALGSGRIAVALDAQPTVTPRLFRLDRQDNNVIARWRDLGSPDYLDRRQLGDLRAGNQLQSAPGAVTVEKVGERWQAVFELECPGVALLELA